MENIANEIFKKRGLKPKTLKSYSSYLRKISEAANSNDINFIDNYQNVNKIILKFKQNSSIRSNYYGMLYVLSKELNKNEKIIKFYQKKMIYYINRSNKKRGENKKSEKEDENWIEWDKLVECPQIIKDQLILTPRNLIESKYQLFMTAVMYSWTVPLRIQEYQYAVITENENNIHDEKKNYIVVLKDKIYFKIHLSKNIDKLIANDASIIPDEIDLDELVENETDYDENDENDEDDEDDDDDETKINFVINHFKPKAENELRDYVKFLKKIGKWVDGGYLFHNKNMNKHYSDVTLNTHIKQAFSSTKKKLTVSIIRKIYETTMQNSNEYQSLTFNEKKQKHREMMHSHTTAQEYKKIEQKK